MDIALFWLTPLLRKGLKTPLEAAVTALIEADLLISQSPNSPQDLPPISHANSSAEAAASLEGLFTAAQPSLFALLFRAHGRTWLWEAVCDTVSTAFALAVPILIARIVDSLARNEAKGLVAALFGCVLGRLFLRQFSAQLHRDAQFRVRAALTGAVYNLFIGAVFAILSVIPTLIPMSSFIFYALHNSTFDAKLIFPALAYFQMLFQPLNDFPQVPNFHHSIMDNKSTWTYDISLVLMGLIACRISWKRVTDFLAASEAESHSVDDINADQLTPVDDGIAISFRGSFEWTSHEASFVTADADASQKKQKNAFQLTDWNLEVKKGSLVAIVGPVVRINGSVAICLQQPWLYSDSVKDNIIFGREFKSTKFENAIDMTALASEIDSLQCGVNTLIGEKGVALSGGQQARVALARAVYDDADIYLLDDPLASLDPHVGKHVFENCVKGLKERNKTILMTTHQLHVLPFVGCVVVVDDGRVVEYGAFADLCGREQGVLAEMVKSVKFDSPGHQADSSREPEVTSSQRIVITDGTPGITEGDRERGAVSFSTLLQYYKFGGGWPLAVVLMSLLTLLYTLIWWTSNAFDWNSRQYLNLFTLVSVGQILVFVIFSSLLNYSGYLAAKNFHAQAISSLFRAPMSFFDTQPIGRIIYRLSNDVQEVDMNLWWILLNVYYLGAGALCSLIIMVVLSPYMLILIAAIIVLNLQTIRLYRSNFRELKRISATQASPVSAFASETLSGLPTIRTFRGAKSRAIARHRVLLDASLQSAYVQESLSIWANLRIGLFTAFTVFGVGLLGVFLPNAGGTGGNVEALMGAALASSWQISVTITQLVFMSGMLDLGMKPARCEGDPKDRTEWPHRGEIEFENLTLKYDGRDEPVIKGLSLKIGAGDKVGVCGRTGSGKSRCWVSV
ncbi:hypothetical protein HDU81_004404 [Chytriomyces hyalinus]|nr:hypothetical protein HDU81_004404 [Chytriomyces hyalinus]